MVSRLEKLALREPAQSPTGQRKTERSPWHHESCCCLWTRSVTRKKNKNKPSPLNIFVALYRSLILPQLHLCLLQVGICNQERERTLHIWFRRREGKISSASLSLSAVTWRILSHGHQAPQRYQHLYLPTLKI